LERLIVRMDGGLMQPLKLAPACLGSRTRDGSHGTRDEKPHHSSTSRGVLVRVLLGRLYQLRKSRVASESGGRHWLR
jgi:hypothetical protein